MRGVGVLVCGRTSAGRVAGIASGADVVVGAAKISARDTLRRCEGVGLR